MRNKISPFHKLHPFFTLTILTISIVQSLEIPESLECMRLNEEKLPLDFFDKGRNSIQCAIEFRVRRSTYISGANNNFIYNITGVITNAFPRSILQTTFRSKKFTLIHTCTDSKVIAPRDGGNKKQRYIAYTSFTVKRKKVKLANSSPMIQMVIKSSDQQTEAIKTRIAEKFITYPLYPVLTDSPAVKISLKRRPPPYEFDDQNYEPFLVRKGKRHGEVKFSVVENQKYLVMECSAVGGSAFLMWRFYQNGINQKSKSSPKNNNKWTQKWSDNPLARNFHVSPPQCHGGTDKCPKLRLIVKQAGLNKYSNGTYECLAFRTKNDYRRSRNFVSRQKASITIFSATCGKNRQVPNSDCPVRIPEKQGVCCQNQGGYYLSCAEGWRGERCSTYIPASTHTNDNSQCQGSVWTVAFIGSSVGLTAFIALIAFGCVMRDQNKRKNLELDLKARKKTPPAKNTKYNLADNIIGKSLEHGLDRIPKTSNAVSHTTSEYGSVGAKRYASADALNSVGNLNRNNNNSSSHEEESSSTIKLETSTLLDNSFNTGHRNSNSRNSRRSPQHIPEIVVGDFGNNEEEYLNESVNLAATPEIIAEDIQES